MVASMEIDLTPPAKGQNHPWGAQWIPRGRPVGDEASPSPRQAEQTSGQLRARAKDGRIGFFNACVRASLAQRVLLHARLEVEWPYRSSR